MTLTKRQKRSARFSGHLFEQAWVTRRALRRIARSLKLTSLAHGSTSTSRRLERKGFVRRGIQSEPVDRGDATAQGRCAKQVLDRHTVEMPLMGRIAAGPSRSRAVEEHETLFAGWNSRARTKTFALQVKGKLDDRRSYSQRRLRRCRADAGCQPRRNCLSRWWEMMMPTLKRFLSRTWRKKFACSPRIRKWLP